MTTTQPPKRPLGAFFVFSNETRPIVKKEHPDFKIGDVGKKLGELWRDLSETDKKKYVENAAENKVKYEKELEKFKSKHPDFVPVAKKKRVSKKTKETIEKDDAVEIDAPVPKKPRKTKKKVVEEVSGDSV